MLCYYFHGKRCMTKEMHTASQSDYFPIMFVSVTRNDHDHSFPFAA